MPGCAFLRALAPPGQGYRFLGWVWANAPITLIPCKEKQENADVQSQHMVIPYKTYPMKIHRAVLENDLSIFGTSILGFRVLQGRDGRSEAQVDATAPVCRTAGACGGPVTLPRYHRTQRMDETNRKHPRDSNECLFVGYTCDFGDCEDVQAGAEVFLPETAILSLETNSADTAAIDELHARLRSCNGDLPPPDPPGDDQRVRRLICKVSGDRSDFGLF